MKSVVLISGHLCTGKSELAEQLRDQFGYQILKSSSLLQRVAESRELPTDRRSLQRFGDQLDDESDGKWLYDEVVRNSKDGKDPSLLVVDNVRTARQLEHFRNASSEIEAIHVHLYVTDTAELGRRWKARSSAHNLGDPNDYPDADLIKNEEDIARFKADADVRIEGRRSDEPDTLVRVAARLGLFAPPDLRCVDVIVGGQYGSEGKGNIAAHLAHEYDVLVRVGGPNAGHTVLSRSGEYTYHQLPSGARDTTARILLGPGMTLDVEKLLSEIDDCQIGADRLFIDPHAMIIERSDKARETSLVSSIGSTGQGGGSAAARRISDRTVGGVRLAKDIPALDKYVGTDVPYRGSTVDRLEEAYRAGRSVLLEGTQGSGLSLYHGSYPHVTSRDTNVAGCLAEAGISPGHVRRIILVVRYTPIRVANPKDGSSGPLKHETSFDEIARIARSSAEELKKNEKTSTTKRDRRVGWFDWEQFRDACSLNAPTDIALTFADYIDSRNEDARRFDQLTPDTIMFVEELERIAHAPVSLISTRFPRADDAKRDIRNVVDRRNWKGKQRS